jgi:hypothetical protein
VETRFVRGGEPLVRRRGEFVLLFSTDLPQQCGEGGVLTHGEFRTRFPVLRDLQADVAGPDVAQCLQACGGVACGVDLHQLLAQPVADRDGGVGGRVGAAGDPGVDHAERDLVGDLDGRLQPGPASLLDIDRRGLGAEPRAENGLTREVEVARVLEHRARVDLADPLTGQVETSREAVEGRGKHLLVRSVGIGAVGAGEGGAVAAEDGHASGLGFHGTYHYP